MRTSSLSGFVLWWPLSSSLVGRSLLRSGCGSLCCTFLIFLPLEPPLSGHPPGLCCWCICCADIVIIHFFPAPFWVRFLTAKQTNTELAHTFRHWWASKPSNPLLPAALVTRRIAYGLMESWESVPWGPFQYLQGSRPGFPWGRQHSYILVIRDK